LKAFIEKLEEILDAGGTRKDIVLLVISAVALICSIFHLIPLRFDIAWVAIILCGVPIILEAVIGLVTAFDIKADVLVSLALIASVCIGEYFAAGEIAVIMQLGGLLEELTVARARAGIEKLVNLTPQTARVMTDQGESVVPAMEVREGQTLHVLPGETIPVDGIILSGQTSVNQAVMTGESMPVDKMTGDEVSSGTVNQFGAFTMKATKVGEDSSIQRMIRLVQSADAGKAKIVGLADRWATWIVVIALTAALLTWLISGKIIRAVTILVVFCPCALVLATPTAIMAAIGNVTKHGFLVSQGDALERLATVSKITFDKTGTLTYGTPKVTAVHSILDEFSDEKLYHIIASAEQLSEHPLGKAIVASYRGTGKECSSVEEFQMIPGEGVCAQVSQNTVLAGNEKMMQSHHVIDR
jgi:heavy metal translocating P-type ATPase